jgi:hemoglobin
MKTFFPSALMLAAVFAVTWLLMPAAFAENDNDSVAVYQGMGGTEGIKRIVADFIVIVGDDKRIKHQFDDVDMKHFSKMLADQLCALSGGPCAYTGKDMHTIHADLGVTDAQFNAVAEDLQTAMDKQGVSSNIQNKLMSKLAPMRRDIVTK